MKKQFRWDSEKNEALQKHRGVCFEMVVGEILSGRSLDIANPSASYPGQRMFLVHLSDYPHLVPFEEDEEAIRLITIIPSRKYK